MMGLWFFATSLGNKLAGNLSGIYVPQSGTLMKLYGGIAAGLFVGTIVLALFTPQIKKLMGNVR
jgi:dipeptide/tripeptide permease